jgi:hypothetical protein
MLREWKPVLRIVSREAMLIVQSETGDVLKARLPLNPGHPRALLTLLEGLALWSGAPLSVAISADAHSMDWLGSGLFGDELFPAESQLVRFSVVQRGCRVRHLRGLGDFRAARRGAR